MAAQVHAANGKAGNEQQEQQLYTQEQLDFCRALPKVELHAHLNGSIRDSTIRWVGPGQMLVGGWLSGWAASSM